MTRAAQVAHAVSAMQKAREDSSPVPEPASLAFLIYQSNGGGYHWTIAVDGGQILAQSASFASYEEARQAAGTVQHGASRASFPDCSSGLPLPNLPTHGDTPTNGDTPTMGDAATARGHLGTKPPPAESGGSPIDGGSQ